MKDKYTNAAQVKPEWLTGILRERGILPQGKVVYVSLRKSQLTFASHVWHIEVDYTKDAPCTSPRKMFLKTTDPSQSSGELNVRQLTKEAFFYSTIAPDMDEAFTIPCYHAAYDLETGASHILLKDVSETHETCLDPIEKGNTEQSIDVLAKLHAFWWNSPRLGTEIGRFPTAEERRKSLAKTEQSTGAFIHELGDQLSGEYRKIYEQVLTSLPHLFRRHESGRNLTLVHGDAHLGNFLFPKNERTTSPYILDWQFWHPTIGGTDLAFLIATGWKVEVRRRLELHLLKRYFNGLLENGVKNYQWDDCWNDYRLSVILVSIFIPVWRWSLFGWAPEMSTLHQSMTAFKDLNCFELL